MGEASEGEAEREPNAAPAVGQLEAARGSKDAPVAPSAYARRRVVRSRARWRAALVLGAPSLFVLANELLRRPKLILTGFDRLHRMGYVGSLACAAVLWASLLYLAASRRSRFAELGAFLFVVLFSLSVGVQLAFRTLWNAYFSIDALVFVRTPWSALSADLPLARPVVLAQLIVTLAFAVGCVVAARRFVRPRRRLPALRPWVAALAIVGVFNFPASFRNGQSSTPELIYFHGLATMAHDRVVTLRTHEPALIRVERRHPDPVPRLEAKPSRPRNVVLLLQESQRADVTCMEWKPRCPLATRATNDLLPRRIGFFQMRAGASSTAIALSNLWAGVDPVDTQPRLLSAPLLWEYAHAAGWDTAYWTSQNMMFGNSRLYVQDLPLGHYAGANDLAPDADWLLGATDDSLSERVIHDWESLREPFFAVVHYCNIHRPRLYDPANAPFRPTHTSDRGTGGDKGKNYYQNAVFASDVAVAKLVSFLRATDKGKRTVLVYTSDHSESYREHENENDHSGSVYDEEIRVPTWIDAPIGTLAPDEEVALRKARTELTWQYDLSATMLDLVGVWDAPEMQRFKERMVGLPLTRRDRVKQPVTLTNTSWIWEYVEPNWGVMQGSRKLLATATDHAYRCFDVLADPKEQTDLGEAGCPELLDVARKRFGPKLPRDLRWLAWHREWPPR